MNAVAKATDHNYFNLVTIREPKIIDDGHGLKVRTSADRSFFPAGGERQGNDSGVDPNCQ